MLIDTFLMGFSTFSGLAQALVWLKQSSYSPDAVQLNNQEPVPKVAMFRWVGQFEALHFDPEWVSLSDR